MLELLESRGVQHLFYFQVDNPLVKIGDAAFLGAHVARRSEASSKCIDKLEAAEKMGVFVDHGGACAIIEYSDLPNDLAEATGPGGELLYRAGSPAIHLFDLAFLRRVAADAESLPFHYARKKVPHLDDATPAAENALKFERFIFDLLPLAERWLVVREKREEEFMPLKKRDGRGLAGNRAPGHDRPSEKASRARRLQGHGRRRGRDLAVVRPRDHRRDDRRADLLRVRNFSTTEYTESTEKEKEEKNLNR